MLPVVKCVQPWFTIADKVNMSSKIRAPVVELGSNVSIVVVNQISFNQGWTENHRILCTTGAQSLQYYVSRSDATCVGTYSMRSMKYLF